MKSLYAHSTILKSRCEYYTQSNSPSAVFLKILVFASAFLEGDSTIAAISKLKSGNPDVSLGQYGTSLQRRIITMTEDFDVVHNVLYYIYTNCITFSIVASDEPQPEGNQPNICDAEDIFMLAHRLDLEGLKKKALKFLGRSCTPRNITSRVFSQFASLYDEVDSVYEDYFKDNWAIIQNSAEFKKDFSLIEEKSDPTEIIRIFGRFRELFQRALFPVIPQIT
jgi:hypothetical protein